MKKLFLFWAAVCASASAWAATYQKVTSVSDLADGDVVRLREGFYEKGEENYLYKVSDINENTGRCLILCINSGAAIPAAESVDVGMVDAV